MPPAPLPLPTHARRHPDLLRLTGRHPFNVEPKPARLFESYITPPSQHYVRNHGAAPRIKWEEHRLAVNGAWVHGPGAWAAFAVFASTFRCLALPRMRCSVLCPLCPLPAPPTVPSCPAPASASFSCPSGLVDRPMTFTMDDILKLPSVDVTCTLTCAGECCEQRRRRRRRQGCMQPVPQAATQPAGAQRCNQHGCWAALAGSVQLPPFCLFPLPPSGSSPLASPLNQWTLQATGGRRRTW